MAFFIFPQRWIGPAITAAALHFGSIGQSAQIEYTKIKGPSINSYALPNVIWIDKLPEDQWPKWRAQCVMIHSYGHLRGKEHTKRPNSIMRGYVTRKVCKRWLRNHDVK